MSKNFLKLAALTFAAILLGCQNAATPNDKPGIQPATKDDLIRLDQPLPEQSVSSPLVIKGAARGTWFFEGSFPVILTDWDGRIIAESFATAESDWMTTDFVNFSAELPFEEPEAVSNRGSLILKKDNPSGLPEHDDALEITVFFE